MNELPQVVCSFQEQQRDKSLPSGTQHTQILSWQQSPQVNDVTLPVGHEGPPIWEDSRPKGTLQELRWDPSSHLRCHRRRLSLPREVGRGEQPVVLFSPLFSWEKAQLLSPGTPNSSHLQGDRSGLQKSLNLMGSPTEKSYLGSVYVPLRSHITPLPS